jgi:hypothetical protein
MVHTGFEPQESTPKYINAFKLACEASEQQIDERNVNQTTTEWPRPSPRKRPSALFHAGNWTSECFDLLIATRYDGMPQKIASVSKV